MVDEEISYSNGAKGGWMKYEEYNSIQLRTDMFRTKSP